MRILIVNKYAHVTGGADQHCIGIARVLRDRGHEVRFLSTASPKNVEREGEFVRLRVTHATRNELPLRRRADVAFRAIWNREAAAAMRRLLATYRPDVVHVHKLHPQLSVAPVVLAARSGVPVVQTLHDLELLGANPLQLASSWFDQLEDRAAYRALNTATFLVRRYVQAGRVRRFIAPSRFVAALYERVGFRAVVVPNFTDLAGEREVPGFSDREGAVFVGRLSEQKGVPHVLELAHRLPSTRFTIAGFGELEPLVRREAAALANLEFVGYAGRDRVESLLRTARLALMPSSQPEIGPLASLEAMAVGTPIVGYENGGLAEYVRDAGGGKVVEASVDALQHACEEVYHDPVTWSELSGKAVTAIAKRHSPRAYAERLHEVYRSVVS